MLLTFLRISFSTPVHRSIHVVETGREEPGVRIRPSDVGYVIGYNENKK